MQTETALGLKAGDLIEVKAANEILETLDGNGAFEGVPFMPEMLRYVGGRYRVSRRVVKFCWYTEDSCSRAIDDCVFLEDQRCDGAAHGGCQQECRIFWKEAWLRRVSTQEAEAGHVRNDPGEGSAQLESVAAATVFQNAQHDQRNEPLYRCQALDILPASRPLPEKELGQYIEEVTSRNIAPGHFARTMFRAFRIHVRIKLGRYRALPMPLGGTARVDGERLNLELGDWVQVRSAEEIGRTLDAEGRHRGLHFSAEMLRACGRTYRVRGRVERIIDEKSGRMLELKNDCVLLEGMICPGERSVGVWFCPRDFYHYWREAWLMRVEAPLGASTDPVSSPLRTSNAA
jgi:hypothetical protein